MHTSSGFVQKHNFLECQKAKVSSRNAPREFFRLHWASFPINLVMWLALDWPFYNFKSFKPNGLASLFRRRNRKTFRYLWILVRVTHFAIAMAGSRACQSIYQNPPPAGEDELAEVAPRAPINDNGTFFYIFAVSYIPTPALALPLAPAELVVKYTNANLQRATKLALKLFV